MGNEISHSGIVERVEDGCVSVRILQTSACAACKVAGHCNASEAKVKIVEVHCDTGASHWEVGQPVTVVAESRVARLALWLGFVLPLLLLLCTLVATIMTTKNEGMAALASLLVLVPYYLVIWALRSQVSRRVSFRLIAKD